ncbi:MAG: hypothetical protein FWD35_01985 [Oscillospiraceae bacterium]|nr:hypothetical protein [Oscillospiraceae bacterium]
MNYGTPGNGTLIILKSITEANKARQQLANYRIKSVVEKVQAQRSGCVYGIRVFGNTDKICRLLKTVNIDCMEVT